MIMECLIRQQVDEGLIPRPSGANKIFRVILRCLYRRDPFGAAGYFIVPSTRTALDT